MPGREPAPGGREPAPGREPARGQESARHTATSASDASAHAVPTRTAGARALAALRLLTGFIFLWAFLDKTFGLRYSTPAGQGWIDGGSPTEGFLSRVTVGPMQSILRSWAGAWWADWLFMLGLLFVGVAVMAGVALRLAAVAGTLMLALMWIASWPPAIHRGDGTPTMSTNPFDNYHVIYAAALIAVAAAGAGATWGLGRPWARLPIVRDHAWLR
ncbi:hypothetical protein NGF19_28160 [Streptomyces sp. RY43-2]|uniref:DoxX family membrane protein n=1 Tax=Streptomyces macrolidinus TaxID=2952607 RepID=A0ABT0ZLZ0_9ACTN|nr:hypothetical protein [Streptomyces macrolidinus]MCN9244609.1 hypothetical protein [Streptomyces macrolidinus]